MPDAQRTTTADGVFRPGQRMLTVGIVLIVTLVASEALAIATVMPAVERELGDLHLYGWVFSAFFLGNLIGVVLAGRLADRLAPIIPFGLGLGLFLLGLIGGGAAQTMLQLVLARGVQGLGAGALPAIAYVSIGRGYSADQRPRMFAVLSTAWVLPAAVGPGFAGFVGEHLSWRWVFLGLLPVVVVGGAIAMWALRSLPGPEVVPGEEGTVRPTTSIGAVFVLAAAAAVLLSSLGDLRSWWSIVLLAASAVVTVLAYRRLTPPGTLRAAAGVPSTIVCQGLFAFAFFSADAFVPLALTEVRGTSVAFVGAVIMTVAIGWTAGSWLQERWIRRLGPPPLVRIGLLALIAGAAGTAAVLLPTVPVHFAFVTWSVAGVGAGFVFGPLSAAMLSAAPLGAEGQTTASFQLTEVLGIALGAGTAGAIVGYGEQAGWSTATPIGIIFAVTVAVGVLALGTTARLPRSVFRDEPRAIVAEGSSVADPSFEVPPAAAS